MICKRRRRREDAVNAALSPFQGDGKDEEQERELIIITERNGMKVRDGRISLLKMKIQGWKTCECLTHFLAQSTSIHPSIRTPESRLCSPYS